jgi:hypothetical protein
MAAAFGSPVNQTQTTTQGIAGYAQPAVNQLLGQATQLAQRPYEAYGGERVAGLSGLQNQALGGVAGLQPVGAFQYSPTQQFTSGIAQQYMNPFTDVLQQREQQRAGQAAAQEGANAVNAGAFGGYRQDVQKAVAADLSAQRSMDIDRQAFENAQSQFNKYQSQDFLRQQAQDRANQLAQQGAMDVYGAQLRAGATPRDIEQQRNEAAYQDFQNRQNYDWQNVGRLQNALSGLPMTNTTQNINYGKPSTTSQLMGAGVALAGVNKLGGLDWAKQGIAKLLPGGGQPNYSYAPTGPLSNSSYRTSYDNPGAYTGADMSWMDSGGIDTGIDGGSYPVPDYVV